MKQVREYSPPNDAQWRLGVVSRPPSSDTSSVPHPGTFYGAIIFSPSPGKGSEHTLSSPGSGESSIIINSLSVNVGMKTSHTIEHPPLEQQRSRKETVRPPTQRLHQGLTGKLDPNILNQHKILQAEAYHLMHLEAFFPLFMEPQRSHTKPPQWLSIAPPTHTAALLCPLC